MTNNRPNLSALANPQTEKLTTSSEDGLSYEDACLLSRIFNRAEHLHVDDFTRINDWLKGLIERAANPAAAWSRRSPFWENMETAPRDTFYYQTLGSEKLEAQP